MKKKPYAITGSIASGKSEFTRYIKQQGYTVIDADKISHQITKKGEYGYEQIILNFGHKILGSFGEIDRKKLSDIVFSNNEKLMLLNNLTHPIIREKILYQIEQCNKRQEKLFFLDIPLLFESNMTDLVYKIILVYCDESIQINRLMQRDKLHIKKAQKIIDTQMSLKEKISRSDILIENNSTLENLYKKIDLLLVDLEKKSNV